MHPDYPQRHGVFLTDPVLRTPNRRRPENLTGWDHTAAYLEQCVREGTASEGQERMLAALRQHEKDMERDQTKLGPPVFTAEGASFQDLRLYAELRAHWEQANKDAYSHLTDLFVD